MACCTSQKHVLVIGIGGVAAILFAFLLLWPMVNSEQGVLFRLEATVSRVAFLPQDADESSDTRMDKNRTMVLEQATGGSRSGHGEGKNITSGHEDNGEEASLAGIGAAVCSEGGEEGDEMVTAVGNAQTRGRRDCTTGRLYVYDMPKRFNKEIIENCDANHTEARCRYLKNQGLGVPMAEVVTEEDAEALREAFGDLSLWYNTGSYEQEVTYHARMLQHPCRTQDPSEASAFYIPYYVLLGVDRDALSGNRTLWTELASAAIDWLKKQPYVARNNGYDHFFHVGHISYAFTSVGSWGNNLLLQPFFTNMTKLPFERNTWDVTMTCVPYPTSFHPSRDHQIQDWLQRVRSAKRRNLVAFVGSKKRLKQGESEKENFQFRNILMDQCEEWDECSLLDCKESRVGEKSLCHSPFVLLQKYLDSNFCLQPKGDSSTRKGTFDSMLAGCIPVFFGSDSAYSQYLWYLPVERETYSVLIPMDDVQAGNTTLKEVLSKYTPEQIESMRKVVIDHILPHIIVANPVTYKLREARDAVDIAVEGMMTKVARLKAGLPHTFPNQYLLDNKPWTAHQFLQPP